MYSSVSSKLPAFRGPKDERIYKTWKLPNAIRRLQKNLHNFEIQVSNILCWL